MAHAGFPAMPVVGLGLAVPAAAAPFLPPGLDLVHPNKAALRATVVAFELDRGRSVSTWTGTAAPDPGQSGIQMRCKSYQAKEKGYTHALRLALETDDADASPKTIDKRLKQQLKLHPYYSSAEHAANPSCKFHLKVPARAAAARAARPRPQPRRHRHRYRRPTSFLSTLPSSLPLFLPLLRVGQLAGDAACSVCTGMHAHGPHACMRTHIILPPSLPSSLPPSLPPTSTDTRPRVRLFAARRGGMDLRLRGPVRATSRWVRQPAGRARPGCLLCPNVCWPPKH